MCVSAQPLRPRISRREGGVARILAAVRDQAAPGTRLAELDATARDVLARARASSPFLGYQPAFAGTPFPAAIGAVGRAAGYGIPADFGGHGIGHAMHEDPHIPNAGRPGRGLRLVPGLVVAIEPWFLAGGIDECEVAPNGWTVRSTDGSRAAHAEHTVAITGDGPVVLTAAA